jgi:L-lactate dehydrogenase complex protein LldE
MPSTSKPSTSAAAPRRVGLFVTCLVDLFRPSAAQTCCGQPAYNSGDRASAAALAREVIRLFAPYDHVVAPSASCAGMLKKHYPSLFAGDPEMEAKALAFSAKVFELTSFLTDVLGVTAVEAEFPAAVAYHDSCSSLREMGVSSQPRILLQSVKGLRLVEMEDVETCCGFGGLFSIKFPEISEAMASGKIARAMEAGAEVVLGADLGCLLNIAGRLSREGAAVEVRHVAEVLAGALDLPPLASPAHDEPEQQAPRGQ